MLSVLIRSYSLNIPIGEIRKSIKRASFLKNLIKWIHPFLCHCCCPRNSNESIFYTFPERKRVSWFVNKALIHINTKDKVSVHNHSNGDLFLLSLLFTRVQWSYRLMPTSRGQRAYPSLTSWWWEEMCNNCDSGTLCWDRWFSPPERSIDSHLQGSNALSKNCLSPTAEAMAIELHKPILYAEKHLLSPLHLPWPINNLQACSRNQNPALDYWFCWIWILSHSLTLMQWQSWYTVK